MLLVLGRNHFRPPPSSTFRLAFCTASSRYWSQMPVPAPRSPVWMANAAGVASKTSEVVTMPVDLPCVRARYSPMYSTRGLSNTSSVSSGNTPSWPFWALLPVT